MITPHSFTDPPKGEWVVYMLCCDTSSVGKTSGQGCRLSYVGITNSFPKRLADHNSGKSRATKGKQWQVSMLLVMPDRAQAAKLEQWLKNGDTSLKRHRFQALRAVAEPRLTIEIQSLLVDALTWDARRNLRAGLFKQVRSQYIMEGTK